ncbi:MAG: alpha/beta hydrolase [Verrucomicrobiota bacterium]
MKRTILFILLLGIGFSFSPRLGAFESDFISVRTEGSGPDVILIHGFACSPEVWAGLADEIKTTHQLHFVTILGFAGTSTEIAILPDHYLEKLRSELIRYMEEAPLEQPTLIGHSMGGLASLLVAGKTSDRLARVIVVDALPFFSLIFNPQATMEQVRPQAEAMERRLLSLTDPQFKMQAQSSVAILTKDDARKAQLLQWSITSQRALYARLMREIMAYDARSILEYIDCEVHVLYAYDSRMGIAEQQLKGLYQKAYSALPRKNFKMIADSFHFIMWDQPDTFYEAITQVLERGPDS